MHICHILVLQHDDYIVYNILSLNIFNLYCNIVNFYYFLVLCQSASVIKQLGLESKCVNQAFQNIWHFAFNLFKEEENNAIIY